MARLNYPTRPEVEARLSGEPTEHPVTLDPLSTAQRNTDGGLTVAMQDGTGSVLAVTYRREPLAHWVIEPLIGGTPHGEPGTIPTALLQRANRLMSTDGPRLEGDWHTKTTRLIAAPRRVKPILSGMAVTAAHTATGWQALATAGVTEASGLSPAPAAPAARPAPSAAPDPLNMPASMQVLKASAYDGEVIMPREMRAKWLAARAVHRQTGKSLVVAMVGPSGQAKTHSAHALAAEEGLDLIRFDASGVTDPSDWFGTINLIDGSTVPAPSDFLWAITLPGPRVLLVDEMNRSAQKALNGILPVLEMAHHVTNPLSGKAEPINHEVQIVVTANMGSEYMAVEPLDEAIRNRIGLWLLVDYLSEAENKALLLNRHGGQPLPKSMTGVNTGDLFVERSPSLLSEYEAGNLARFGQEMLVSSATGLHPAVSSRQLLAAANLTAIGLDPRLAVDGAIVDGFDREGGKESPRMKVQPHVNGIVWREPKAAPAQPGDLFTGQPGDPCITCGHTAVQHGIGTSVETSCEVVGCLMQCKTYSPATTPVEGAPA